MRARSRCAALRHHSDTAGDSAQERVARDQLVDRLRVEPGRTDHPLRNNQEQGTN